MEEASLESQRLSNALQSARNPCWHGSLSSEACVPCSLPVRPGEAPVCGTPVMRGDNGKPSKALIEPEPLQQMPL